MCILQIYYVIYEISVLYTPIKHCLVLKSSKFGLVTYHSTSPERPKEARGLENSVTFEDISRARYRVSDGTLYP